MKTMKLFAAFLAAVSVACAALTSASAADAFKIETLAIPADAGEAFANMGGILAQDDGSLDTFSLMSSNGKAEAVYHHRSTDGGKTWKKQDDTAWFAECAKKYDIPGDQYNSPEPFEPGVIVTDGKGSFYFTAATRKQEYQDENLGTVFSVMGLFRLSGGQATLVKEYGQRPETPSLFAYSDGALAMQNRPAGPDRRNNCRLLLVNPADGAIRYEYEFKGMQPVAYAGGKASGWNQYTTVEMEGKQPEKVGREVDKRLWIVFDTATGREIQKVVNPLDHMDRDDFELFYTASGSDGGTFFAGVEGLYRLKPGAQSFEKLMDGTAAGFAGKRSCYAFSAGKKGDFYAVTAYTNRDNWEDAQNGKQMKLLHFVPV